MLEFGEKNRKTTVWKQSLPFEDNTVWRLSTVYAGIKGEEKTKNLKTLK